MNARTLRRAGVTVSLMAFLTSGCTFSVQTPTLRAASRGEAADYDDAPGQSVLLRHCWASGRGEAPLPTR
jgi:hypothetical protein